LGRLSAAVAGCWPPMAAVAGCWPPMAAVAGCGPPVGGGCGLLGRLWRRLWVAGRLWRRLGVAGPPMAAVVGCWAAFGGGCGLRAAFGGGWGGRFFLGGLIWGGGSSTMGGWSGSEPTTETTQPWNPALIASSRSAWPHDPPRPCSARSKSSSSPTGRGTLAIWRRCGAGWDSIPGRRWIFSTRWSRWVFAAARAGDLSQAPGCRALPSTRPSPPVWAASWRWPSIASIPSGAR